MAEVEETVVAPAGAGEEEEEEIAVAAGGGAADEEEFVPAGGVEIKLYGKWSFDDIEVRDISLVVRFCTLKMACLPSFVVLVSSRL
jgi:small subunit ribosomal protein S5e